MIGTENPAAERSGSVSEELRRNPLQKPPEIENTNDLKTTKKCDESRFAEPQGNPSLKHRDNFCFFPMNYQWSRVVEPSSGNHRVHFRKDPNCDICLKTKK